MLGRRAMLDDLFAKDAERLAGLPDIGERRDGAQLVGALANILVHSRDGAAPRLDQREGFSRVDRGQLLSVADQDELVDTHQRADVLKSEHVLARHH